MKSVRLGADLEARLRTAARMAGQSESQLVRDAVATRCDQILRERLDLCLESFIGKVSLPGLAGRQVHNQYRDALSDKFNRPHP